MGEIILFLKPGCHPVSSGSSEFSSEDPVLRCITSLISLLLVSFEILHVCQSQAVHASVCTCVCVCAQCVCQQFTQDYSVDVCVHVSTIVMLCVVVMIPVCSKVPNCTWFVDFQQVCIKNQSVTSAFYVCVIIVSNHSLFFLV